MGPSVRTARSAQCFWVAELQTKAAREISLRHFMNHISHCFKAFPGREKQIPQKAFSQKSLSLKGLSDQGLLFFGYCSSKESHPVCLSAAPGKATQSRFGEAGRCRVELATRRLEASPARAVPAHHKSSCHSIQLYRSLSRLRRQRKLSRSHRCLWVVDQGQRPAFAGGAAAERPGADDKASTAAAEGGGQPTPGAGGAEARADDKAAEDG